MSPDLNCLHNLIKNLNKLDINDEVWCGTFS